VQSLLTLCGIQRGPGNSVDASFVPVLCTEQEGDGYKGGHGTQPIPTRLLSCLLPTYCRGTSETRVSRCLATAQMGIKAAALAASMLDLSLHLRLQPTVQKALAPTSRFGGSTRRAA
jgi:hypothetical protein